MARARGGRLDGSQDPGAGPEGLTDILAGLGITIVPTSRRRRPGETHAGAVMRQVSGEHGMDVLALSLRLIRGSQRNAEALSSETIAAVADVLAQMPEWRDRPDELARTFNSIDLDDLRARAVARRPWPVRNSLRSALFELIEFGMGRPNDTGWTRIAA